MSMPLFLGVGSAHIDVLGTVTGDPHVKDRMGDIRMEIGGTGGNVSVNCAMLGAHMRFLTALNGSAHARIIEEHLEQAGIELLVHEDPLLPMPAFMAQIDKHGDMEHAISCMPVDRVEFSKELLAQAFEGAALAFLDCNVSVATLSACLSMADTHQIPCFLAGVSEEKTLRALAAIRTGHPCAGLFMNRREAMYLAHRGVGAYVDDRHLAEHVGCPLIISEGEAGVVLATAEHVVRVPALTLTRDGGSLLGAGDALMAGTLWYWWSVCRYQGAMSAPQREQALAEALRMAIGTAAEVVLRDNCNLAEPRALDRAINVFHDEARKDGLTGLLNRTSATAMSHKLFARSNTSLCVIMLDIDHFKSINDTWGHPVGDTVIQEVAACIRQSVRDGDVAARWGGEEFLCVLSNTGITEGCQVAERIRSLVQEQIRSPKSVTVSLGLAVRDAAPLSATDGMAELRNFTDMVQKADQALYASKSQGRNRWTLAVD